MANDVEIEITQGNLNNSHLYLREHLGFFPSDAVGPANLRDGQGTILTIRFDGVADPVRTDIAGGNKLILRDRRSWRRFYAVHRLRAGDRVTIERIGRYEYAISPGERPSDHASHVRGHAGQSTTTSPQTASLPAASGRQRLGRFEQFEATVAALPVPLSEDDMLHPALLVEREGPLAVYYAPVEWVRPAAKVAIVGITPGKHTMKIALETAAEGLRNGEPPEVFLDRVKSRASFSGMRGQLINWLDDLNLHRHLGLDSSAALWTERGAQLLHPTSSIRYPVLNDGANYSGSRPRILKSPMLSRYVEDVLAPELAEVPDALVVPLGKRVDEALGWLAKRGFLDPARVLSGFPHASGANGHRHKQWAHRAELLRGLTARWFA